MKKETKIDIIFSKYYDGIITLIPFSDFPDFILPSDKIDIERVDAWYSENNSWDDHTILKVCREREETDEEFNERLERAQKDIKEMKERRYKTYLKLKEEFEQPNDSI